MQLMKAKISGLSPLLQHRFPDEATVDKPSRKQFETRGTPRQEAEKVVYRNGGTFYHPGAAFARMLREAGANHKMKGSRRAVKWLVPSAVIVPEEHYDLYDSTWKKPLKDFDVDSRPVTIPSTKGRIMRHRPRFDNWGITLELEIDDEILPVDLVETLMHEGGRRLGIGDFRPQTGGPFGRFSVRGWDKVQ